MENNKLDVIDWLNDMANDDDWPSYYSDSEIRLLAKDALEALKAQELPPVKPEKLEEKTTKWLDNMTAEKRLEEIAAILDDWDGYRTAKGLAGLINEVWAYALYPVKAQEPRVMTLDEVKQAKGRDVWLELSVNVITAATIEGCGTGGICTRYESLKYTQYCVKPYGWRCWTSRPTEEEREKVKWNE